MRPIVLSVAGFDPSGGAGVLADLKAIEACGGYAATVATAVAVQNSCGVRQVVPLGPRLVADQLRALLDDFEVAAVKTGMLGSPQTVSTVAELLRERAPRACVVDVVAQASRGGPLNAGETLEAIARRLAPLATLIAANVEDARAMTGVAVRDEAGAEEAGKHLLDLGCGAALVKGGHFGGRQAVDLLVTVAGVQRFTGDRIDTPHTHGSGCVHASAIATGLARGLELAEAVRAAKEFVTACIRSALALGAGQGPVDPLHALHEGRGAGAEVAGP